MKLNQLQNFLFGTLRGRLILSVALVHAVMMSLFIADLSRRQKIMLLDRQVEEATALSQALSVTASGWLSANDIAGLQELVDAQNRYPEIVFAMLTDQDGRILAHSDQSRIGQFLLDLPNDKNLSIVNKSSHLVDVVVPVILASKHVGWARIGIGQKISEKKMSTITRDGVFYALLAILFGSLIAWFMGRLITRRLYAVQNTIREVKSGNRTARSCLSGEDEAASIASEFNTLLDTLDQQNRKLQAISNCNQVLMRAEEEQSLLNEICNIICSEAGYRMVWVGYAENDEAKTVRPVAWAGYDSGYITNARHSWSADTEHGRGPCGESIRTGKIVYIRDFTTDPQMTPWRESAIHRGYQSAIALPLKDENANSFGTLLIYSTEINAFPPDELRLLEELAGDLAFGIMVLRIRSKRKQVEEALQESSTRLNEAQNIAHIGSWDLDIANDVLTWSDEIYRIFEIDPNKFDASYEAFLEAIHPDDRDAVNSAYTNSLKTRISYAIDHRLLFADGRIKYVHEQCKTFYDADGKPLRSMGIVQDITEQKKSEQELINAKEKAEQSERLKTAFLANMSHEIRTPMNGILGFAELLKEPNLTGAEQQEYINIIEKSGARMLNIINNIVDISKIEAGLMNVNIKESNVNEQIEYIYTFFKPEVESKGMQLYYKNGLPTKEAIVRTDTEKVYSILANLVKNAIKYTNEGSIEFGYKIVESIHRLSLLEFYVKDTGIGIPKERQKAIFERFIQADITDKMARQGAGLGLTIAKSYVEMLGGKIRVESQEGVGSTFYFTLPYNAEPEEKKVVGKVDLAEDIENQINPEVSGLKILIAEDDEISEKLISITIKMFSKEVIEARTGNEAVEICRANPDLDLILMDIQMPDLNGHEATRQIRQFNKDVVIIAQTAFGLSGDREKAIEAGCNDYIAKPVKKDELLALIQKYFKK